MTWLNYGRWRGLRRHEREVARLAGLPEYLLRDMGLTLEGQAALTRQLTGPAQRA